MRHQLYWCKISLPKVEIQFLSAAYHIFETAAFSLQPYFYFNSSYIKIAHSIKYTLVSSFSSDDPQEYKT